MIRRLFGLNDWAQPVTNTTWGVIACALFALSQASGYRVLNGAKGHAHCRACGVA